MKHIYLFGEGNKDMKDLLGGKGANLAEMTTLGLPVPFGFTITTGVCDYFLRNQGYPVGFDKQLQESLAIVEEKMGKKFGDAENPLLVSVRSGAKMSMPGMMDTVLNLGLNDETVEGLAIKTGNPRFAFDSYRRFITMFGNVVLGIDHDFFEHELDTIKESKGIVLDTDLTVDDLKNLVGLYKNIVKNESGKEFPMQPHEQLQLAMEAVFNSWVNTRAVTYRRIHNIHGLLGTAVTIQSMVFGNMGETSGTGVAFTRNPSTGEREFYGEYLMNAQGEDVVAGLRTPEKIETLGDVQPEAYQQLLEIKDKLENHYKNMQDIEFTVEEGKLYFLQTRNGKRTAQAAIRVAVEMVDEGLITKEEALLQLDPAQLNHLLHPQIDPKAPKEVIAKGLPASPGAACGKVVFSADDAYEWATNRNESVILVRKETSPEDIHGMHSSAGILTALGGMTSHAAVVARGMGKCCIVGCKDIIVNKKHKKIHIGDVVINEGDVITLNGSTGEIMLGSMPMSTPEITGHFEIMMKWADEIRTMKVRANADTPEDALAGREFGAEGIGLCRTEHMFFDEERIQAMREMILSKDVDGRKRALKKLIPFQRKDFEGIFKAMDGLPVTVRLLDPPLHEFLPDKDKKIQVLADEMGLTFEELKNTVESLHEVNPMLGHRGCRLGISYPEIYEMQVQAIIEAAINVAKEGIKPLPEIEVPLVGNVRELAEVRKNIETVIASYGDAINFDVKIGTMIELPRACLTADKIAEKADFFSFGTNDLTQTVYGFSRDDIGKFIDVYINKGIVERDPSETLDTEGVGALMQIAVEKGRATNPEMEIGICGEHGGDPESVKFCHNLGLDFVSCSPFRVPIARLSAAQAAIISKNVKL